MNKENKQPKPPKSETQPPVKEVDREKLTELQLNFVRFMLCGD